MVKFLDFGQYKYELTKREKEAKRKQRSVTFKEVRLSPKIGIGDFDTKVHRAIEFLEDGDRIKVTVRFRGRELTHPEIGRGLLARFVDRVKDHGVAERTPLLEGKSMHITMASIHKPKIHEAPDRGARRTRALGDRRGGGRHRPKRRRPRRQQRKPAEAAPSRQPAPAEATHRRHGSTDSGTRRRPRRRTGASDRPTGRGRRRRNETTAQAGAGAGTTGE